MSAYILFNQNENKTPIYIMMSKCFHIRCHLFYLQKVSPGISRSFIQKGLKPIAEMQPAAALTTVLGMAQPELGSMGGITSTDSGSDGKQECLTHGQQTDKPTQRACTGADSRADSRGHLSNPEHVFGAREVVVR